MTRLTIIICKTTKMMNLQIKINPYQPIGITQLTVYKLLVIPRAGKTNKIKPSKMELGAKLLLVIIPYYGMQLTINISKAIIVMKHL
jgi:hypothetical protein